MIHFDLDDRYQDELVVGTAISRREGVMFSALLHGVLAILLLFLPSLPLFQRAAEELQVPPDAIEPDASQMVFVQPRLDMPSPRPPPAAELSDLDRRSQAPQVAERPENPLPFSEGDSAAREEAIDPRERAAGPESPVDPDPLSEADAALAPDEDVVRPPDNGLVPPPSRPRPGGSLGEALRNLDRYVQNETFHNPQGGAIDPGATIQFDSKGVDFGPWLRRFVAQVKRNWFIPHAAMTFRGRVVLQFNIHRNGAITDLVVAESSQIDAFNRAAFNAILGSNPTEPLPLDYPDPMAFFTVAFYYNEYPPGQVP